MLEALAAMALGGALARWVLWPIELRLIRRQLRHLHDRAGRLGDDLRKQ